MNTTHNYKKLKLIIMRGIPGSSKSYTAQQLKAKSPNDTEIFSTDDYFILNGNGTYKFDHTKLGAAHRWNYHRVVDAINRKVQTIIVDNTNIKAKDFKNYIIVAVENGYDVELKEGSAPWKYDVNECFKRNTHGVPYSTIEKMAKNFEHNLTVEKILSGK